MEEEKKVDQPKQPETPVAPPQPSASPVPPSPNPQAPGTEPIPSSVQSFLNQPQAQKPIEAHHTHKFFTIILGIIILILLIVAAGFGYYIMKGQKSPTIQSQNSPLPTIQEEPVVTTSPDPTADWQTYTNDQVGISFKYPSEYKIEERVKNYIVVVDSSENPSKVIYTLDLRGTGPFQSFDSAVAAAQKNKTEVQVTNLSQGTQVTGVITSGFGEGQKITQVFFPAGSAAYVFETNSTDEEDLTTFNQSVLSFLSQTTSQADNETSPSATQ